MEKIILTDCDGVLCNWNNGFARFAADKGFPQLPGTDTDYNISDRHGITPANAFALVREFNEGPWIADLEPFADSVEYVTKLAREGFRFIVVTSISDTPQAKYFRTKNLKELFGDVFDEINCIAMGSKKGSTLNRWLGKGYFWIEDHEKQAEDGYRVGLKPILIRHMYNSGYNTDLFPIVNNAKPWEEIYNIIKGAYN